jgi:hypothetical protein
VAAASRIDEAATAAAALPGSQPPAGGSSAGAPAGAPPAFAKPPPPAAPSPASPPSPPLDPVAISPTRLPFLAAGAAPPQGAALAAAHRAARLVSQLTSGGAAQQREAAEALLEALRAHGDPVRRASHQAGGTHMLGTLVSSNDAQLSELCVAALAEALAHPPALAEVARAGREAARVVGAACRGVEAGRREAAALLAALVRAEGDAVAAALAHHRAVPRFVAALQAPALPAGREQPAGAPAAALLALEAVCCGGGARGGAGLRKLVWGSGLPALVPMLHSGG